MTRIFLCTKAVAATLLATGFAQGDRPEPSVKIDPETRLVIDESLGWLAARQSASGAWIGSAREESRYPVAMTSYALMAFLAAGHLPDEGEHGAVVTRGVDYLLSQVSEDGLFPSKNAGHYMYEHGIATIVLAEVYGQSRAENLKDRLQRLIRIIVSSQNAEGGWRYRPIAYDADISVTVLQVVALRAAKINGLVVPARTIADAVNYVRMCYVPSEGGFAYQPGEEAGFARTAAAIYSLQVCGVYDDPRIPRGSNYLLNHVRPDEQWFTYGCFYAAPAQYMLGGETWERWYERMKAILLPAVRRQDGHSYWDTALDGSSPGPLYSTAVYTMVLAMPNHYLPLYQR